MINMEVFTMINWKCFKVICPEVFRSDTELVVLGFQAIVFDC